MPKSKSPRDYVLIIAEKPDAARRIAEALADSKPKVIKKNGVTSYEFKVNGKKHICAPAVGHLFVLEANDGKKTWDYPIFSYDWVPTYLRRETAWTRKYFENLKDLAKGASEFIDAADVDTEGEVLLYNILRFICGVKDAKRMKFSTLTKEELIEAYNNLEKHIFFDILESGLTRHELDWLFGINLTRALTLAMKKSAKRAFSVISTGRVQGPLLKILVDREKEIRKFVPRKFWQIKIELKKGSSKLIALYEIDKIWKKAEAEKIVRKCKGKTVTVASVKRREYLQKPPYPFNTADLQTEAYNQFGLSPAETLSVAESLYTRGYISYPRSSSQKLPPKIGYSKIIKGLSKISTYRKFCEKLLKKEKLAPREGPLTDVAHPCVYATQETPDLKKLRPRERKIYDLIARRTLATFGDAAKRESLKVVLQVDGYKFLLNGRRTISPGWMEIYKPYLKIEENVLPELKEGEELKILKIELLEKETQPPPRYTQGSIIKEMEKRGLGTRATRAEILKTLYERNYIKGKSIVVTKFGEAVVEVLEKFCPRILSEELTRKFEKEMEEVMNRKKKRSEVVEEAKVFLKKVLKEFKENDEKIGKNLLKAYREFKRSSRTLGKCPKCGGDLVIIRSKKTKLLFVGCSNYPKCKNAYPLPRGARIEKTGKICEHCNTPIIRIKRKGRRTFSMCLDPNCKSKESWGKKNDYSNSKTSKSS